MPGVTDLWNKEVDDCCTKIAADHVQGPFGVMKRVYCLACHKACYLVTLDVEHVVAICNKCAEKGDAKIGLPDITDLLKRADMCVEA